MVWPRTHQILLAFWKEAGRSHRVALADLDDDEVEELLATDKTFHFRWRHPGWTRYGSLGPQTGSRHRIGGRGTSVFLPGAADSDFVPPLTHRLPVPRICIIRGYAAKSMQKHPSDGKTKSRMSHSPVVNAWRVDPSVEI